jgi:hypothetical protein
MKKFKDLGTELSRNEQKQVFGGSAMFCQLFGKQCSVTLANCCPTLYCNSFTLTCAYVSK